MSKTIREVKDELHEMFPQYRGFVEHTLVATMCNQYHLKQGQKLPIDSVVGQSEQLCDHPRSERSYIGQNMLRCNKCGKEFS